MELSHTGAKTRRHKLEIPQRLLGIAKFTFGFHAVLYDCSLCLPLWHTANKYPPGSAALRAGLAARRSRSVTRGALFPVADIYGAADRAFAFLSFSV
jgi:hypothetical protein